MPSDFNGSYTTCLTNLWKKLRIYHRNLGIFTLPRVLAPFWQHLGCPFFFQLSLVKLYYQLIDLNEPRFESHTKGKMRETLKNDGNLSIFC